MPDDSSDKQHDLISGGHLVAKALKAEGVEVTYTLCGGHIIDIYDGCVDEGIDVVDVRHEQVAAHAADGYARITGKPGCAVVTAGPGTTDAVTGVANAFRAESPMLLIGGQGAQPAQDGVPPGPPARRHDDADHQVRGDGSRHGTRRRHGFDGVPRVLPRRSRTVLPGDSARCAGCQGSGGEGTGARGRAVPASTRAAGDPEAVEKLADLLVHAEKPAVLLGSQVWVDPDSYAPGTMNQTMYK
ncbi:thiamine pyrophosphate-binding protein [Streptomyces sp. NPDC051219]|uniref:thiamine pyrophosphate-binding protein n=1 Tax=Streptomyces sp. NPDC051219 TaxID=3155283 RepID=UPI00343B2D39